MVNIFTWFHIDPYLCTHIVYAFAKINVDRIAPYEWNDENSGATKGQLIANAQLDDYIKQ